MPQKFLYDVSQLDPHQVAFPIEEIRKVNPHRHEFEQLTAILLFRPEEKLIVGLRELRDDEFWVRGHIPGRPLFPGVLMLEAAAQLCSFYCGKEFPGDGFLGFGGIDEVRFRGIVRPGERLFLVACGKVTTPNRCQFATQGIVGGKLVFEANILGLRLPVKQS
jgi:3-hydroxyacyl-[acyl-carrier-protein] dehydratase